jgi:hypothetical protein
VPQKHLVAKAAAAQTRRATRRKHPVARAVAAQTRRVTLQRHLAAKAAAAEITVFDTPEKLHEQVNRMLRTY